ncbi:unnamed protein product [Linum trigynum]|uniref:F-box domain-containing protein n=1 Tax=Linum trigynum TaxID=586398 RepID=A0AAV2DHU1_9ROSI
MMNLRKRTREPHVPSPNLPHLPYDVVAMILSFLDIKQLAQSAVVAKSFRDCLKLGQLLDFKQPIFKKLVRKRVYVPFVGRIIDQHKGPKIQSLKLWFDPINTEEHWAMVAGWINKAAQKGVEEFDFDFYYGPQVFLLTDEIFQIKTLQILRLSYCDIVLPEPETNFAVTGLPCLRVLSFGNMDIQNMTVVEAILKACSKLETLELLHCFFPRYLKIDAWHLKNFKECKLVTCPKIVEVAVDAPNLMTLHYSGPMVVFKYTNFDKLTDCIIDFKPNRVYYSIGVYKLDQLMYDMSNIEVLTTSSRLLEGLCPRGSHGENTIVNFFCFSKLKEIQLLMEGSRYCGLFAIASFLQKCPSVEKIHIHCRGWFRTDNVISRSSRPGGFTWVLQQQFLVKRGIGPCYPNLKVVKLTGFRFAPHEMQLLIHFLVTGLSLETVAIFLPSPRSVNGPFKFMDETRLNQYFRPAMASPKARIRVFEHFQDKLFCPSKHPTKWHSRP